MNNKEKIIAIGRYTNLAAAQIDQEELMSNGINCILRGESTMALPSLFSNDANALTLCVLESNVEKAKEILKNKEETASHADHTMDEKLAAFERLLNIMDELRIKCPWDKKQTFDSLRANTIEETYELCDAIMKKDMMEVKKELGDVLLHIVFYAKMASENSSFDIADVCNSLCDKLIFRHPHVFGEGSANTASQVEQSWEQLKRKEKDGNKSVLSGVPDALPALIKAYRIQDKARNVGFDWDEKEQVWDKVKEEFEELQAEIKQMDADKMEAEFGDLLFSMINAARLYKINPENALERTNRKFIHRFNYLEEQTLKKGIELKSLSLEEMDKYWNEAKQREKDKEETK